MLRAVTPLLLVLSLVLASCTREAVGPLPSAEAEAEAEDGERRIPAYVFIALGALVIVALVLASSDSDPFLDYSDICGTPDCS